MRELRDKLSLIQNELKASKTEVSKGKEWIDKLQTNLDNQTKTNKALMTDVKSANDKATKANE
jgi:hypothetical protein